MHGVILVGCVAIEDVAFVPAVPFSVVLVRGDPERRIRDSEVVVAVIVEFPMLLPIPSIVVLPNVVVIVESPLIIVDITADVEIAEEVTVTVVESDK